MLSKRVRVGMLGMLGTTGAVVFAAVLSVGSFQAQTTGTVTTQPAEPRPGPGRETFLKMCSECHRVADVIASRRSRDQWHEVINKMLDKGAVGTDEEAETTLRYLLTSYGRVNVNKAPAADVVLVLGLEIELADAIIKYRTDNGPFKDFDALARVPGLEVAQLEKIRDAITY